MNTVTDSVRCPVCRGRLAAEETGLRCPDHGLYPVVDDIPSFVGGCVFDSHWKDVAAPDLPPSKMEAAREFLAPALDFLKDRPDGRFLDAGCGDGVHVAALSGPGVLGPQARAFALDLSREALVTTRSRADGRWGFVHGDAGRLPFAEDYFDCVLCFGVLGHFQEPRPAFDGLVKVLRPGGLLGVWLMPRPRGLSGLAFRAARAACSLAGPAVTRLAAHALVPFLGLMSTRSGVHLGNATWTQCHEVAHVNLATPLSFPEADRIRAWFDRPDLDVVHEDPAHPVSIWARKSDRA